MFSMSHSVVVFAEGFMCRKAECRVPHLPEDHNYTSHRPNQFETRSVKKIKEKKVFVQWFDTKSDPANTKQLITQI